MKPAIKICGLCDPELAKKTVSLGAQYIGILCFRGSKRYVTPEVGQKIAEAVIAAGGIPVAVCVDLNAKAMLSLCEKMGVKTVQLTGEISRRSHHELPSDMQRIYVLSVTEDGIIQTDVEQGIEQLDVKRDCIMFDGMQSGSGRTFQLKHLVNPYPMPFFLAGGLNSNNVADAIREVHPDVVDVSSGVESEPGVKDIDKIKAFIEAVRGVQYE